MAGANTLNGRLPHVSTEMFSDEVALVSIAGVDRTIVQLDAFGWDIYDRIRGIIIDARDGKAPPDAISTKEFYSLVERVLPDTPKDDIWGTETKRGAINAELGGYILGLASKTLQAVEESVPKAEAPTGGRKRKPSSA